jgi:SAM-dependent methyltransferase
MQWFRGLQQLPYFWRTARRLDRDGFDQRHGTDTSRLMRTRAAAGYLVNRYETAGTDAIERAIGGVGVDLSRFTFLDLGCGKGKPLLLAAGHPFRCLIGVDISAPCLAIARRNVERCGLGGRIELVHTDVTEYEAPAGPLFIYLFNPFPARILGLVLDRLVARLVREREPIAIVYMNPEHADVIDRSGCFRCVSDLPGEASPYERTLVYVSTDPCGTAGH